MALGRRGRQRLYGIGAAWVVGAVAFRVVLTPVEICPTPTADEVLAAAFEAADWSVRAIGEGGRFTYGYDRADDSVNPAYNEVRHAALVNALYQLVEAGHERYLEPTDSALVYILDRLVDHDDWTAFIEPGNHAVLGSTGLMVAGLAHRRLATLDDRYDDLMRRGGRFILNQQEDRGSLLRLWDRSARERIPDQYSAFSTGEAMWALVLLHRIFPDEGWDAPARVSMRYLATDGRRSHEDHVLRLPDHWAAHTLGELAPYGLSDEAASYGRALAGDFAVMTRIESQKTGAGINKLVRGRRALGAGLGALGEGVTSLWLAAEHDEQIAAVRDELVEQVRCVAGMLVDRQVDADEAAQYGQPDLGRGAWFTYDKTLIDDQQHPISALLVAHRILAEAEEAQG